MESTFFYSKYCNHCKNFILELKKENLLKSFENIICVDKRKSLPEFVTTVPCILIEDYDQPLFGEKAFAWIKYIKMKKSEEIEKNNPINAFDFNNSFDNFDELDHDETKDKQCLSKDNCQALGMLEQPLLSEKEKKELLLKFDKTDVKSRYAELEQSRK
ncbi:uncharacterized protein METZ01_LOCUS106032 [marine metagenome]|uniref:Thioredoxin-like fold domain-containing protein n=1 Tax=marine metagenome TaxID=408172 RepID=A0A381WLV6_9ZZZZ